METDNFCNRTKLTMSSIRTGLILLTRSVESTKRSFHNPNLQKWRTRPFSLFSFFFFLFAFQGLIESLKNGWWWFPCQIIDFFLFSTDGSFFFYTTLVSFFHFSVRKWCGRRFEADLFVRPRNPFGFHFGIWFLLVSCLTGGARMELWNQKKNRFRSFLFHPLIGWCSASWMVCKKKWIFGQWFAKKMDFWPMRIDDTYDWYLLKMMK